MSVPKIPPPAKLVFSIIFAPQREANGEVAEKSPMHLVKALFELERRYGPPDFLSQVLPFTYTDYYCKEMGPDLQRRLVSMEKLVPRDCLPKVKLATSRLEKRLAGEGGRRRVNIDPGLLTPESFILATGKNFTHRIYLGRGIFADLTLIFQKGKFVALPWTFPDYASSEIQSILGRMRKLLLEQLRNLALTSTNI